MRRTLFLVGAALLAGVAVAVASPAPKAKADTAPWFQVQSQVAFGGSFVTVSADVKNTCTTITHMGTVTLTLVKTWPYYTKMLTRTWVVSLKPQASVNLNPLPNAAYTLGFGHYVVTTTAVHIWQFRDTVPGGMTTSHWVAFDIP